MARCKFFFFATPYDMNNDILSTYFHLGNQIIHMIENLKNKNCVLPSVFASSDEPHSYRNCSNKRKGPLLGQRSPSLSLCYFTLTTHKAFKKNKQMGQIIQFWPISVTKKSLSISRIKQTRKKTTKFCILENACLFQCPFLRIKCSLFLVFKFFMQNLFVTGQSAIPHRIKSYNFGIFQPILTFLDLFGNGFKFRI